MKHNVTLTVLGILGTMPAKAITAPPPHTFTLHGGHFYGPGPITPDTPLPDGAIRNIEFDTQKMHGVAVFGPGGKILSDGTTTTNGNIDAGNLAIGGSHSEGKVFWLYAVAGGPNTGQERYAFDADYNMVWTVDLALDPGFSDGIVRVNNFQLTTGTREIPLSLQTQQHIPDGYDKAGSLVSGSKLTGRVGDFDTDGFLDGIIVASANVPMEADMLPGAPVGNQREFKTDIPIQPLFALELTLRGVQNLRPLFESELRDNKLEPLTARLTDIRERLTTARDNYEAAFLSAKPEARLGLREISWRLESIRQLFYIPWAFMVTYKFPAGAPNSIADSTQRAFAKTEALTELLAQQRKGAVAP